VGSVIGRDPEYRIGSAAMWLARDLTACQVLVAGEPVARSRLHANRLLAIGEPIRGEPLTLDDRLALRVEGVRLNEENGEQSDPDLRIVTLDEFAGVDEPGAEPILGTEEDTLISKSATVMVYGGGGAGKTTLCVDLAFHFAAGDDWIGIAVLRCLRVLVVENEGPRPLFRKKLRRKRDSWTGSGIGDRLRVFEDPWRRFTFGETSWRQRLAAAIGEQAIDVVIVGPITSSGMEAAGTLQEVRDFAALVDDVRDRSGRPVVFILVHHENRAGQVSGAWEPVGETLLHVQPQGHGKLRLHVQKARGSSEHHGTTLHLLWADGERFTVEENVELDDEAIGQLILAAIRENPGTGWTRVEQETRGIRSERRRAVRDDLLRAGTIVNVAKKDGERIILDHCPERRPASLHLADDPTIGHLRPDPDADGTQAASGSG
jgi:AAA domain